MRAKGVVGINRRHRAWRLSQRLGFWGLYQRFSSIPYLLPAALLQIPLPSTLRTRLILTVPSVVLKHAYLKSQSRRIVAPNYSS